MQHKLGDSDLLEKILGQLMVQIWMLQSENKALYDKIKTLEEHNNLKPGTTEE